MAIRQSATRICFSDPLGIVDDFKQDLLAQFPLLNLHWNVPGRPLRSVPSLEVELVSIDEIGPQHQIIGLSDSPLVQLIFFEAENTDVYRGKVRKIVQAWKKQVGSLRDPCGCIAVLYVGRGGRRSKSTWAKVSSDFGNNAWQLYLDDSSTVSEEWAKFSNMLKLQILDAFGQRVHAYEEEILKLQSTRNLVGWNFGTMFVMKENLALALEKMNFLEDAYNIYDEILKITDPALFETGHLCSQSRIELPPILQTERDLVVEKMLSQTASEFEFKRYVYARQLSLLLYMSQAAALSSASLADKILSQAAYKAFEFTHTLTQVLIRSDVAHIDLMTWQYSAAHDVLEALKALASSIEAIGGRAELFLLKLDALLCCAKLENFTINGLTSEICLEAESADTKFNQERTHIFKTREEFEIQFNDLIMETLTVLRESNKLRSVERILYQLSMINYSKGDETAGLSGVERCIDFHRDVGWAGIVSSCFLVYLTMARQQQNQRAVLKGSWGILKCNENIKEAECERCVSEIEQLSSEYEFESTVSEWFSLNVNNYIYGKDGNYCIDVTLDPIYTCSSFPTFNFCEISAKVIDPKIPDHAQVRFVGQVSPGSTKISLRAVNFVEGDLQLDRLTLRLNKQKLVHTFDPTDAQSQVKMHPLMDCLHYEARISELLTVNKCEIEFKLWNSYPISGQLIFQPTQGLQMLDDKTRQFQMPAGKNDLTLSIIALIDSSAVDASFIIRVYEEDGSSYIFEHTFPFGLHIQVHAQDFFRERKVFSQFLLSCTSSQPVRVIETSLTSSATMKAKPVFEQEPCLVLDGSPVSYIYDIQCSKIDTEKSAANRGLKLQVTHRACRWECELLLWEKLKAHLDKKVLNYEAVIKPIIAQLPVDVVSYVAQRSFRVQMDDLADVLTPGLRGLPQDIQADIIEAMESSFASAISLSNEEESLLDPLNVTLSVVAPEPEVDVLCFVDLLVEQKDAYFVGEKIDAKMTINLDSRWCNANKSSDLTYRYHIDTNCEGWSFSGQCRGEYSTDAEIPLVLVPHKAGKLHLPIVRIVAVNDDVSIEVIRNYILTSVNVLPTVNRLAITF